MKPKTDENDINFGKLDMTNSDENVSADNDPFSGCEPVKK
jgi:hypothetical protein